MAFRDFDAGREEQEQEPIRFRLGGVEWTLITPLPLGELVNLAYDNRGDIAAIGTLAVLKLYDWIVPEQRAAWRAMVANLTDNSVLSEVVQYIGEAAAARPTVAG